MSISETIFEPDRDRECRAVEVLTSDRTGDVIGYRVGGGRPGPNLLVIGAGAVIETLFERLIGLPTLPWMWGRLYLVSQDAVEPGLKGCPFGTLPEVVFDDVLALPLSEAQEDADPVRDSYRVILRACSGMGMIAGRGVYLSG